MKRLTKRKAETALAQRSKKLADEQCTLVEPERLCEAIAQFVEWRSVSYWLRLMVETEGLLSNETTKFLNQRCPGFLKCMATFSKQQVREPQFVWLRFLEWVDQTHFQFATAQGWRHALGYFATRDPRMDRIRAHWKQSRLDWAQKPPAPPPTFDAWRRSAF